MRPRAKAVDAAAARDGDQPRHLAAAQRVEHLRARPRLDERFLQHLLRVLGVAQDADQQRVQRGRVAVVQLFERGDIAAGDGGRRALGLTLESIRKR